MNFNVSRSAAHKLALVPASRHNWCCELVICECLCQVSLGLKEHETGSLVVKLNKGLILPWKLVNLNVS